MSWAFQRRYWKQLVDANPHLLGFGLRASGLYLKPSETRKSTSATEAVALDSNGKARFEEHCIYIPINTICPGQ